MRSDRAAIACAWAVLAVLLAGCRPYVMGNSAVEQYPSSEQEIDFLGAVERMPAVTNNDALHGFIMLQDGEDPNTTFEARVAEGKRRGWFPMGAPKAPNEAAKVGWLASAGCVVMDVKCGVSMHLFGPVPRYATRELVYMEILPLRTENQILTGAEFVDFLNRLDRIAGKSRRDRSPSPLGIPAGHEGAEAKAEVPARPLGMPAGESAVTPGNEAAIQEGPLPEMGPQQEPYPPEAPSTVGGTAPATPPPQPSPPPKPIAPPPEGPPSSVPGPMRPAKPASDPSQNNPGFQGF